MTSLANVPSNMTITNEILFSKQPNAPSVIVFYQGLGLILSGMILSSIWVYMLKYYEHFHRKDSVWLQVGVGIGGTVTTAAFAANLAFLHDMAFQGFTDYGGLIKFDLFLNIGTAVCQELCFLSANLFYSWRIYKLSKRVIFPLIVLLPMTAEAGFSLHLLILGFRPPKISLLTLLDLEKFLESLVSKFKVVASLQVTCDILVCTMMLWFLWRSREEYLGLETSLLRRVTILIFEAMIPPACGVVLALIAASTPHTAGLKNWTRAVWLPICLLYLQSTIISLYSRKRVRAVLENQLGHSIGHQVGPSHHNASWTTSEHGLAVSVSREVGGTVPDYLHTISPKEYFDQVLKMNGADVPRYEDNNRGGV